MFITIPLGNGIETTVSEQDAELVIGKRWFCTEVSKGKRYAMRSEKRDGIQRTVYLHRLIAAAAPDQMVDHINGDGLDNRRENLRLCDASLNNVNRRHYKPISGFRGVYSRRDRWYVALWTKGRRINGGTFASKEDAARAYDALAREHFGDFAVLNFPERAEA